MRVGHPHTDHWPRDFQMGHSRAERRAKLSNTRGVYSSYGLGQEDTAKKSNTDFVPMHIDLQRTFKTDQMVLVFTHQYNLLGK
jgi:hypothetical protein